MGSASSKDAASSSSSGGASRRSSSRSRGIRPLNSSCFRLPSVLEDDQSEEDNAIAKVHAHTDEAVNKSARRDNEGCSRLKFPRHSKMPSLTSSDVEDNEEGQNSTAPINLDASSSSSTATASNGRSVNPSGRSRSRFAFIPDRIGFRLSRTVSLGSSGAQSRFSDHLSIPNSDGDGRVLVSLDNSAGNLNEAQHNVSVETNSSRDILRSDVAVEHTIRSYSHRSRIDSESAEMRRLNRRLGPQEPLEGSVRFSRTLSVGRLRDRVLRRTTSSEGVFGTAMLEDRYTGLANARRGIGGRQRVASSSHRSNDVLPDSSSNHSYLMDNLRDDSYSHELETPQPREAASNHDLLEHRSAFLERRRRIRSQVRALQRLGSRFENLSGHDRSCILSGQHRTGRCTCRASNRPANPDDDTSTRASISRIVMLAEALFEVLDEIHQQSVVMSSRSSFSSIGSVPAPKEVVECMPVKAFTKPQKHQNEEAAQCYICLVEYEDGDYMRILPCNHEFHRTCIDKWLKEIHRVCPLCRGDVCRSDVSSVEKVS